MKKKPYYCCCLSGLLLLFSLILSPPGQAQSGPHVPAQVQPTHRSYFGIAYRPERRLEISSSVTAIDAASILRTFTLPERDLKQIVTYTPSHVLTSMSSQINIRGVNNGSSLQYVNHTVYNYNPDRALTHSLTVVSPLDGQPLYCTEQLEVLRNPATTSLYGQNAVSGVVNLVTKKEVDSHFSNGRYTNVYELPKIDYTNIRNNYETSWTTALSAKLKMEPYTSTVPDNTYGINGKLITNWVPNNDFFIEEKKYMDGNNVLRQWTDTEVYPELYTSQQTKFYSCEGQPLHTRLEFTDMYGFNFNQFELKYKDGAPDFGYFMPDTKAAPAFRQYFNPTLDAYVPNIEMPKLLQKNDAFYNYQFVPNYGACEEKEENDYPHHVLTFGISYRLEDFGIETKGFIGPTASYTHFFCPSFGATADATINFGKVDPTKYTIGSYYGGVTFVPFHKSLGLDDPSTLSAHVLAGYTSVMQKYMGNSNSNGNFSVKLGVGYDYNFQDNLGIRAEVDDNIVRGNGHTSNNFSFMAGLRLSF